MASEESDSWSDNSQYSSGYESPKTFVLAMYIEASNIKINDDQLKNITSVFGKGNPPQRRIHKTTIQVSLFDEVNGQLSDYKELKLKHKTYSHLTSLCNESFEYYDGDRFDQFVNVTNPDHPYIIKNDKDVQLLMSGDKIKFNLLHVDLHPQTIDDMDKDQ